MRLAAVCLIAALASVPADAQVLRAGRAPARVTNARGGVLRYVVGVSGLTGDCAKTPPTGLTQVACYDFANGSYTSDGMTPQSSFTAAGGTLPSGCTVTNGSGLVCTGSPATIATTAPATNEFVLSKATLASGSNSGAYSLGTSPNIFLDYENNTLRRFGNNSNLGSGTLSNSSQTAVCAASASLTYYSIDGGAAGSGSSTSTGSNPSANGTLTVGGTNGTSRPNATVLSVRIFTGTCSAANVQAASAS